MLISNMRKPINTSEDAQIHATQISIFMIPTQESWHEFKSSVYANDKTFHHL